MTIKTLSFLTLVLWITHLMQKMNEQEKEREGRTTPKKSEGWVFLYWDDYEDYSDE